TLEIRMQAETSYRKATVEDKISRARNSQSRPVVKYYPGDLASGGLRLARWYGPARILALETKVTFSGEIRQPHQLAWIISQGRLKRVHVLQLRHASEREKVIAEDGQVITTPWTFGDVAAGLNKGAFEDLVEDRALRREQKPDDRGAKQERRKFGFADGELLRNELFKRAKRPHELEDRPQHVIREQPEAERDVLGFVSELQEFEDIVFAVILPEPKDETEWKAIVKDPQKFMVVRAAIGNVPPHRLMKMRWVLTFKNGPEDGTVKAKAPLVVLGYFDPDAGYLNTKSPTMTRRSRQLLLQMAAHRGWRVTKADARAAFLQGGETQLQRQVFGLPVEELATAMDLPKGRAVQFLKATYGLTVAPREWFLKVDAILTEVGLTRLKTEPCMWSLKVPDMNREDGKQRVLGLISAHVDDFLITGDESDERWNQAVKQFHAALKWSPWEEAPMMHCGVQLQQLRDGGWLLDQEEYCSGLSQVTRDGTGKELTENERSQARAVLGAVQRRVYQSGPQHAAKLSHLQSVLPRGDSTVLGEINKLVREVYGQKDTALRIFNLNAKKEDDLVVVGWSDAALANRVDLGSTGGYMIGMCHASMLDGVRGPVSLISWSSTRLKRVCRSSLSAETQALAETEQEVMFIRTQWSEMSGFPVDLAKPEECTKKTKGVLVVDAKALYDAASNGETQTSAFSMREKYTALELLGLVENMGRQDTQMRWCDSDAQLADGLTKLSAQDRARKFLQAGQLWNLVHDEKFVSAKKKKQALLRGEAEEDGSQDFLLELGWLQPPVMMFVYCLKRSADVTEKATRVAPLMNSWSAQENENWMDLERQYVVQHIQQSHAGFHVHGVRLSASVVNKLCYYYAAFTFSVMSTLWNSGSGGHRRSA
ncbi:unnamed protein product, partial [Effrenium voratum]